MTGLTANEGLLFYLCKLMRRGCLRDVTGMLKRDPLREHCENVEPELSGEGIGSGGDQDHVEQQDRGQVSRQRHSAAVLWRSEGLQRFVQFCAALRRGDSSLI